MQIDSNSATIGLSVILQGGSLVALGYAIRILRRVDRVMWEHDLMWSDYRKTHGMNGHNNTHTHAAGAGK